MDERALRRWTNQHRGQKDNTSKVCVCTHTPIDSYISTVQKCALPHHWLLTRCFLSRKKILDRI